MSNATGAAKLLGMRWRTIALLMAGAGLALLIAANAHLVYVAFQSQPDCVPHTKSAGEPGTFRAARSAC